MFLTPLFEVRRPPADKFLSLSYDASGAVTRYKYTDSQGKVNTVSIPRNILDRMVIATLKDGQVLYMDKTGKLILEGAPAGF